MANIVFIVAPAQSHYNGTYRIARELKRRGHSVTYVDTHYAFERDIKSQGFAVDKIDSALFPKLAVSDAPTRAGRAYENIRNRFRYRRAVDDFILQGTVYDGVMNRLKPDLFILDVHFTYDAILLYKYRVPTLIIQTYVSLNKAPLVPIFTSRLVPKDTVFCKLLCEATWGGYFIKRYFISRVNRYFSLSMEKRMRSYPLLTKIAASTHFPLREAADFDRALHMGLNNLPELITSPREFDFPGKPKKNQYYVGPVVDQERTQAALSQADIALLAKLDAGKQQGKTLIYCSLGTVSVFQYKGCTQFFRKVIEAFATDQSHRLILAVGKNIEPGAFGPLPVNVSVYQYVPQIEILKRADLMITHGGIQSVSECIFSGVPMLVYPLSSDFDQNGNAARVVYHGLGLRGHIRRDTSMQIHRKAHQVLASPLFKRNATAMQARIEVSTSFQDGITLIESYLPVQVNA